MPHIHSFITKSRLHVGDMLLLIFLTASYAFGQTKSFMYDNALRSYIQYIPSSYDGSKQVPLIINMHGLGSNASQQQLYTQFDGIADTAGFIIVYPNGLSNTWNSGFNLTYQSGTDDVGFISALIDTVTAHYAIDPSMVYASGMSMGGFMSYRLACELQDRIAAIAPVTGLMGDSVKHYCASSNAVPVIHFHGTADLTVPYAGNIGFSGVDSTMAWWAKRNHCNPTPTVTSIPDINQQDQCTATRYLYANGSDNSEVVLYKITNGGHSWPGMYPVASLGNTNQDINASKEIWNFFRKHPMKKSMTSGLKKPQETQMSLIPNPFTDHLTLKFPKLTRRISIADLHGRVLHCIDVLTGKESMSIDTSFLNHGVYLFVAEHPDGKSFGKCIKTID